MKLPSESKDQKVASNHNDVDSILVAQGTVHKGAMFGILSNGGKKSIGNYVIEVVANGSMFPTIQIYQSALGITPKVQSWQKTKTVTKKAEPPKKKQEEVVETMQVQTTIDDEDLF